MPQLLNKLRERLLHAGIAPRHVRRYLAELTDHLTDLRAEEEHSGRTPREAESAALQRLGTLDDLAAAMTTQPRLRSWSARAPWAVFGIAPLVLLAAAYLIACFYLWSLWLIFLPGAETPFGYVTHSHIYSLNNICFQAGKFYYLSAPILVGWFSLLIAARQRIRAAYPIAAALLLALINSTAHIQASRFAVPGNPAHIRMTFVLAKSMPGLYAEFVAILVIFTLTIFPYLLWQLRQRSLIKGS